MSGQQGEFMGPGNSGQAARRLGQVYAVGTGVGLVVILGLLGFVFRTPFTPTAHGAIGTMVVLLVLLFIAVALTVEGFRTARTQFRFAAGPDTTTVWYVVDADGLSARAGLINYASRSVPWSAMRGLARRDGTLQLRFRTPGMMIERTLTLDGSFATREGMTFGSRFPILYDQAHGAPGTAPDRTPLTATSMPADAIPEGPLQPFQVARRGAAAHVQLTLVGAPLSGAPEVIAGEVVRIFRDATGLLTPGQTVAFASPFGEGSGIVITPDSWRWSQVVEVYLERSSLHRSWRAAPGQATLLAEPTSDPALPENVAPSGVIDVRLRDVIP